VTQLTPRLKRWILVCGALLAATLLVFTLHAATGFGGTGVDDFFGIWIYDALMLGAAGSCPAPC
jgi:hypothetical protein